jgi:hypothetical protein
MAVTVMLALQAQPASAQVLFWSDQAAFQQVSATSVAATFEKFPKGWLDTTIYIPPHKPITEGGVTFTPGDTNSFRAPNLFVATPEGPAKPLFCVLLGSNVLSVSGNENIAMDFSTAPTAVGFDTYTNPYNAAVVRVYDTRGNLLATSSPLTLIQSSCSRGFVGITSTVPIGRVHWLADRGEIVNTGIDNVLVGTRR